jgi:hypothetical protein
MRDKIKHFPVHWIDGMKINKNHFISQDKAWRDALYDASAISLSPVRYGILPPSAAGEDNFNVKISVDNQNSIRVTVLYCNAITPGGVRIILPALSTVAQTDVETLPTLSFDVSAAAVAHTWWAVLLVHPFSMQPAGSPDISENPPRYPLMLPTYSIQVVSEIEYRQFAYHPYALTIGKIDANGSQLRVDENYIPACYSVNAHQDLVTLHYELDQFFGKLETHCIQIVQKIYKKNQQNEISELVMFLCDRLVIYVSQALTNMRWNLLHEPPASLFAAIAALARLMKNTIDLRIGSGKDELMNYLCEWCELKQGELDHMLSKLANEGFDNNDCNQIIQEIVSFVKVISRMFETLSKLEFIGKRKESGIFVKEESHNSADTPKPRRRFLG